MIKASALYMVIVITLIIAVLCSALIATAFFFRLQYQQKQRYSNLHRNLESATNIILADTSRQYNIPQTLSLFNEKGDSVSLQRLPWGAFDVGVAKAFDNGDTLYSIFSIGQKLDSAKWTVLYLPDEGRPLSVGGATYIRGAVSIPAAGINPAYVDNKPYTGDERIVFGTKHSSEKMLPALKAERLGIIQQYFQGTAPTAELAVSDSFNSFTQPERVVRQGKMPLDLRGIKLRGHIMILSDTIVTVDSTCHLDQVIIAARYIRVMDGFKGSCQLYATDSLLIGKRVTLDYPSGLGLLSSDQSNSGVLKADVGTTINGTVFTSSGANAPILMFGKSVTVNGQVYAGGTFFYNQLARINGSIYAGKFLYKNAYTAFENYLINIRIDQQSLSPYYLSSMIFPTASGQNKIMQWLELK